MEGWANLANQLRILAQKGYPNLKDSEGAAGLEVFLLLIDNFQIAFTVRQRRPAMLDTAVSATLEIECATYGIQITYSGRSCEQ